MAKTQLRNLDINTWIVLVYPSIAGFSTYIQIFWGCTVRFRTISLRSSGHLHCMDPLDLYLLYIGKCF